VWHRLCTAITLFLPSLLSTTVSLSPQGDRPRERGLVSVMRQAERYNTMQQVIVSRNEKEDVWVATPTGDLLVECFFKAPEERPEEVEHMGIRSCFTCILPRSFWSALGLRRRRWRRFLWRREFERSTGGAPLQALSCPGPAGMTALHRHSE
jgi:hypothetical protein